MSNSYNHLRVFFSTLNTQTGEIYQPKYLSTEAYETIINGGMQTGDNSLGKGNGQGGYRGGRP